MALLRRTQFTRCSQAPFSDHAHEFDACECRRGRTKGLETRRRSRRSLDRPVILLNDIGRMFPSPDFDVRPRRSL